MKESKTGKKRKVKASRKKATAIEHKHESRKIFKKGDFVWISWVLLLAFTVVTSAILYNWMFGFTKGSSENIQKRAMNAQQCDSVGLSIDSACQDSKSLYIDLTNRNTLNVDIAIVRLYNIYGEPMEPLLEKRISLPPKETTRIQVAKAGAVQKADIIPITIQSGVEITCTERVSHTDNVPFSENCQG